MGLKENELYQAALEYAAMGWHVFPCRTDKAPYLRRGFKGATTDPKKITQWWIRWPHANIGIATGASGLVVVDLDVDSGRDGIKAWKKLGISAKGSLQQVTPRYGMHLIFKDGTDGSLRNSASRLARGVDVRGNGGYILVPPSVVENGRAYHPVNDWSQPPAPVPQALVELLEKIRAKQGEEGGDLPTDRTPKLKRVLRHAVTAASTGRRNELGFWLATKLRESDVTYEDAKIYMGYYWKNVPQSPDAPYTKHEALLSLKSAYRMFG